MNKQKQRNDKKIVVIVSGILIFLVLAFVFGTQNNTIEDSSSSSTITPTATNEAGGYTLSEAEAKSYCQDPTLIAKYLNLEKIDILASPFKVDQPGNSYNADAFGYDKNGNSIVYVTWKGWDKTSEEAVTFSCYVSGPNKDAITLYNLRASEYYSGQDTYLYGDEKFDHYDKDGALIPLE